MLLVAGAGDDAHHRHQAADALHGVDGGRGVVHGQHHRARLVDAQFAQQLGPAGVAEHQRHAGLALMGDELGVVLDGDEGHALLGQHLPHHLPDAAIAGDDHVAAEFADFHVFRRRRCGAAVDVVAQALAQAGDHRRDQHRHADHDQHELPHLTLEQPERERHADDDEGELAALAEQQPALGRAPPRQPEHPQQHEDDQRLHRQQADHG